MLDQAIVKLLFSEGAELFYFLVSKPLQSLSFPSLLLPFSLFLTLLLLPLFFPFPLLSSPCLLSFPSFPRLLFSFPFSPLFSFPPLFSSHHGRMTGCPIFQAYSDSVGLCNPANFRLRYFLLTPASPFRIQNVGVLPKYVPKISLPVEHPKFRLGLNF